MTFNHISRSKDLVKIPCLDYMLSTLNPILLTLYIKVLLGNGFGVTLNHVSRSNVIVKADLFDFQY